MRVAAMFRNPITDHMDFHRAALECWIGNEGWNPSLVANGVARWWDTDHIVEAMSGFTFNRCCHYEPVDGHVRRLFIRPEG